MKIGREDVKDINAYMQAFYCGQSDALRKIQPSICRHIAVDEETMEKAELSIMMN